MDASEEHEALSETCLRNIEGTPVELKGGDDAAIPRLFAPIDPSSGDISVFFDVFDMGFRVVKGPRDLFPVSPRIDLDSDSVTFIDLTLGAPDIKCETNLIYQIYPSIESSQF